MMVGIVIHDMGHGVQLLVYTVLGLAEFTDSLTESFSELRKLLRAEHDEHDHENDDHVRAGQIGEERKGVHRSQRLE